MKRVSSILVTALAAAFVPVVSGVVTPASGATALPIGTVRDMVVDQAHGKVFLSGKTVATTDLSGKVLGTITGFTNAGRMSKSADGTHILVIDGSSIKTIDATTSTLDQTVPLGDGICPASVAPASGKVFFTYATCGTSSPPGQMGVVDLSTGAVTTELPAGGDGSGSLAVIPDQPNQLAAIFGGTLATVDTVGGDTPTASIHDSITVDYPAYFSGLAVSVNGSKIYAGVGNVLGVYQVSDLAKTASYTGSDGQVWVAATRADGLIATSSRGDSYSYLRIYKPGVSAAFATTRYDLPRTPFLLGFGSNLLYNVYKTSTTSASYLSVVTPGPPAKLTIHADHTVYPFNGDATVVATLSSPTTSRKVSIFITTAGGSERLLKSGTVSSTGKLVVKVAALKHNTRFRAVFKTDGLYADASVATSIKVRAKVSMASSSTRTDGIFHLMPASPSPVVYGSVAPSQPYQSVRFTGSVWKDGRWSLYGSRYWRLSSTSRFSVAAIGFKPGQKLRFAVTFVGNDLNASSTTAYYYVKLT